LPRLECVHLSPGGALRIHGEPHRPDHDADNARGDILRDLGAVFLGQLFSFNVVRADFRTDHGAVALRTLRLNNRYRMRITAGVPAANAERTPTRMTNSPHVPYQQSDNQCARARVLQLNQSQKEGRPKPPSPPSIAKQRVQIARHDFGLATRCAATGTGTMPARLHAPSMNRRM
jgi:hypothetical protein